MSRWHVTAETFDTQWGDRQHYQPLLKADGRHWAWTWLRRNHAYQDAVARLRTRSEVLALGEAVCCLKTANLNRLFHQGYLFAQALGASVTWKTDCSGAPTSIRRSSPSQPNPYPAITSMPSISPIFPASLIL